MWGYNVPLSVTEAIGEAKSVEEIEIVAESFLNGIGFDRMAFHLAHSGPHSDRLIVLICNYPKAWLQTYFDNNYIYHDLIQQRSIKSVVPFEWRRLAYDAVSETTMAMFEEAAQHGVADGFSVPLHSAMTQGVFSVIPHGSFEERTRALSQGAGAVTMLAHVIHDRVLTLVEPEKGAGIARAATLTPREKECLMWLSSGKSGAEIGQILKISTNTANQHIHTCMEKLSASTRAQAAVRGVLMGIVRPVE